VECHLQGQSILGGQLPEDALVTPEHAPLHLVGRLVEEALRVTRGLDPLHRGGDPFPARPAGVDPGHEQARDALRLGAPEGRHLLLHLDAQRPPVFVGAQASLLDLGTLQLDQLAVLGPDLHQGAPVHPQVDPVPALPEHGAADGTRGEPPDDEGADHHRADGAVEDGLLPAASELVPVAPGGELVPEGPSDADELQTFGVTGEAHVLGGDAEAGVPEEPLARLDGLPAFLHG
jgi:hypothetical protein